MNGPVPEPGSDVRFAPPSVDEYLPVPPETTPAFGIEYYLGGEAALNALYQAVDDLRQSAPSDQDVLVWAFDILVDEVRLIKPHTLVLRGLNQEGHHTFAVVHFSQLVAHVIFRPKRQEERVITGFWSGTTPFTGAKGGG